MFIGILALMGTGVFWAIVGAVMSRSTRAGQDYTAIRTANGIWMTLAALLLFPDWRTTQVIDMPALGTLGLTFLCAGILNCCGILLLIRAMRVGHNGVAWTLSQSAFIVPFLAGVVFYGETLGEIGWVGAGLCLAAVIQFGCLREAPLTSDNAPALRVNGTLLAVGAMLCLGVQQTLTTLPSHWNMPATVMSFRIPTFSLLCTLAFAVAMRMRGVRLDRQCILWGLYLTAGGLCSQGLYYFGLDRLAAGGALSLALPIAVSSCLIVFSAYSALRMKETFTWRHGFALGGVLASLLCFGMGA